MGVGRYWPDPGGLTREPNKSINYSNMDKTRQETARVESRNWMRYAKRRRGAAPMGRAKAAGIH